MRSLVLVGSILLSSVSCVGSETSLGNCSHGGWGNTAGCTHKNDVGIVCTDSESCGAGQGAGWLQSTHT